MLLDPFILRQDWNYNGFSRFWCLATKVGSSTKVMFDLFLPKRQNSGNADNAWISLHHEPVTIATRKQIFKVRLFSEAFLYKKIDTLWTEPIDPFFQIIPVNHSVYLGRRMHYLFCNLRMKSFVGSLPVVCTILMPSRVDLEEIIHHETQHLSLLMCLWTLLLSRKRSLVKTNETKDVKPSFPCLPNWK